MESCGVSLVDAVLGRDLTSLAVLRDHDADFNSESPVQINRWAVLLPTMLSMLSILPAMSILSSTLDTLLSMIDSADT